MRARLTHRLSLACALVTLAVACTTIDTTVAPNTTIGPGTTSVSVDPGSFLGAVACSDSPGGMQSYVSTITDVTHEFVLPSSPPTSCTQSTYFEYITVSDRFTAVVDGYDKPADELVPLCGVPGPSIPCQVDAECGVSNGCAGQCLITTYGNEDPACVESCAAPADLAAFKTCLAANQFCQKTSLADYVACLEGCVPTPANLGAFADCLAAPPNGAPPDCLANGFTALRSDCPDAPVGTVDGGGAIEFGAVKGCTCIYTAVEGSRQMLLKSTGEPYAPRWQTPTDQACGAPPPTDGGVGDAGTVDADAGVVSVVWVNVGIAPCGALVDNGGGATAVTTIQVIPVDSLPSSLSCALAGGTVTSFAVVPSDPTLATVPSLACPSPGGVSFTQGVVAGASYTFTIQAFEGGATPTQQSCCVATARAGLTVAAACDPLVPIGDAGVCPPPQ